MFNSIIMCIQHQLILWNKAVSALSLLRHNMHRQTEISHSCKQAQDILSAWPKCHINCLLSFLNLFKNIIKHKNTFYSHLLNHCINLVGSYQFFIMSLPQTWSTRSLLLIVSLANYLLWVYSYSNIATALSSSLIYTY